MARVLKKEDFTKLLQIDWGAPNIQGSLDFYIDEYEKILLTDLFGEKMYIDFLANQTDEKYTALINGEEMEDWNFTGLKPMLSHFITFYAKRANDEITNKKRQYLNWVWNRGVYFYNRCIYYINEKNKTEILFPDFLPTKKDKLTNF
jgi:hypothetical protein